MASLPMVASGGGNFGYVQSTCTLNTSYATYNVSGMSKIYYVIIWGKPSTNDFSTLFERNSDNTVTKIDLISRAFDGDVSNIYDTSFVAKWAVNNRTFNYIAFGELS